MKIFHIHHNFNPAGGAEIYIDLLVKQLEHLGHESAIGYAHAQPNTIRNGPALYYLPWNAHSKYINKKILERSLVEAIEHFNPDVIQLHNTKNPHLTKIVRKLRPTVRFIHDPGLICPRDWKLKSNYEYCDSSFGKECAKCFSAFSIKNRYLFFIKHKKEIEETSLLDAVIVASDKMKHELIINGFNASTIHILPYFISRNKALENIKTEDDLIVFVGVIHKIKGLHVLLNALSMLQEKPWRLVVIGEGTMSHSMKDLAVKLGIAHRVNFMGWLTNDLTRQWIAKSAFVVAPSIWLEGFGIVGLEAMCEKKPVIGSDIGGIPDWLHHNVNGLLTSPGNVSRLSENISLLLSDSALREKMGASGYDLFMNKFSKQQHMDKLLGIYTFITKKKAPVTLTISHVKNDETLINKSPGKKCLACLSDKLADSYSKNGFNYYKCFACGFISTINPPNKTELETHYNQAYSTGVAHVLFGSEQFKRNQGIARLKILESKMKPGTILDIGSSFGFFLDEAQKRTWKAKGLEISKVPFEYSTETLGLDIENHSIDNCNFEYGSFDAITLWDVLEHIPDPESTINTMAQLLRKDGYIGLSLPNCDSWLFSVMGAKWPWFSPPSHLHFFTPSSIYPFLDRHGFEVVAMKSVQGDSDNEILLMLKHYLSKWTLPTYLFNKITLWARSFLNSNSYSVSIRREYDDLLKGSELIVWAKKR